MCVRRAPSCENVVAIGITALIGLVLAVAQKSTFLHLLQTHDLSIVTDLPIVIATSSSDTAETHTSVVYNASQEHTIHGDSGCKL